MSTTTLLNGDCISLMDQASPESIDLIIADPPYYKVVNEGWDYAWHTQDDYMKWCELWLRKCYDKLRIGGTMYVFGYFRVLNRFIDLMKNIGFSFRQQIVVDKGLKSIAGRATKNYRLFPCTTESILFFTKNNIEFSRGLLKGRQRDLGLTAREINEALGMKSNGGGVWSLYTGDNVCEQFPTREVWDKLKDILKFDLNYDKFAQTFNPEMGITDVWNDIDFYEEKRVHPTQKPLKLINRLVNVSSNAGDTVLDPFMGSGSTGVSCKLMNRNFIGIELDSDYFNLAKSRIEST